MSLEQTFERTGCEILDLNVGLKLDYATARVTMPFYCNSFKTGSYEVVLESPWLEGDPWEEDPDNRGLGADTLTRAHRRNFERACRRCPLFEECTGQVYDKDNEGRQIGEIVYSSGRDIESFLKPETGYIAFAQIQTGVKGSTKEEAVAEFEAMLSERMGKSVKIDWK
ncbi:MAG: hypothetical protein AAB546_04400 [Patescibacteria group bacterium]